jgi:hypothetical protein
MTTVEHQEHLCPALRANLVNQVIDLVVADILLAALLARVVGDQRFVQPVVFITMGPPWLIRQLRAVSTEMKHNLRGRTVGWQRLDSVDQLLKGLAYPVAGCLFVNKHTQTALRESKPLDEQMTHGAHVVDAPLQLLAGAQVLISADPDQ